MLRTLLRDEANQFRVVDDPLAISDIVRHRERLLWLDLEAPSAADFALIKDEFHLHPLAIEDAMARHQRPKVDQYENFYLVVFYSVAVEEPGEEGTLQGRRGLKGTDFHRPAPPPGSDGAAPAGPSPTGTDGDATFVIPTPMGPAMGGDTWTADPNLLQDNGNGDGNGNGTAGSERIVLRELAMFMGENYLITVHTYPIPELDEAARRWRRNVEVIGKSSALPDSGQVPGTRTLTQREDAQLSHGNHPAVVEEDTSGARAEATPSRSRQPDDIGILLYSLLDSITDNYFPVIDSIVDRVEDLEEQIFERYSQQAIESIFTLKKDLLALRKVLAPERDVLNVLIRRDLPIFEAHTLVYFQDVYDHVVRITDSIDTYRDLLSSALDSFLSMQSNRLNITVQTLTAVSIILMSIAAVTGWYGMNLKMPETQDGSYTYYAIIIVIVAAMVTTEVLFFKRKKWL